MRQRGKEEKTLKGFGVDQSHTIIRSLASTLNYLDYLSIIYRGRSQSRTMTLAEGREKCDFRFKKGGKTDVAMPQSLR